MNWKWKVYFWIAAVMVGAGIVSVIVKAGDANFSLIGSAVINALSLVGLYSYVYNKALIPYRSVWIFTFWLLMTQEVLGLLEEFKGEFLLASLLANLITTIFMIPYYLAIFRLAYRRK
ncbi:MAG: hypothetical protein KJ967_06225 [Elusimicrobia bacterium]|nr:hypothetical protein [Elusimicrobiota bacterium]